MLGSLSDKSNVTDLVGCSDNFVIDLARSVMDSVSSFSESSESHRVSLLVESSLVAESGVILGFQSFSNCFMQRRVGCSPPHFLHCSGGPTSSLIHSAYVRVGRSSLRFAYCFRVLVSFSNDRSERGAFVDHSRVSMSFL